MAADDLLHRVLGTHSDPCAKHRRPLHPVVTVRCRVPHRFGDIQEVSVLYISEPWQTVVGDLCQSESKFLTKATQIRTYEEEMLSMWEREMSAWGSCPRQVLWTGVPGAQGRLSSALKGLSTSARINALSYFFGPQLGLWCVLPMSLVDGWANYRVLLLWQTLH